MNSHTLPDHVVSIGSTPRFDNATLPEAVTSNHRLGPDRWGLLHLHQGNVWFVDLENNDEIELQAPAQWVIAPSLIHKLRVDGPFELHIEFLRQSD